MPLTLTAELCLCCIQVWPTEGATDTEDGLGLTLPVDPSEGATRSDLLPYY